MRLIHGVLIAISLVVVFLMMGCKSNEAGKTVSEVKRNDGKVNKVVSTTEPVTGDTKAAPVATAPSAPPSAGGASPSVAMSSNEDKLSGPAARRLKETGKPLPISAGPPTATSGSAPGGSTSAPPSAPPPSAGQ